MIPEQDARTATTDERAELTPIARRERAACPACGRANATRRLRCLYCGAAFEVAADVAGAALMHSDVVAAHASHNATGACYNIMLLPGESAAARPQSLPAIVCAEVNRLLGVDEARFERMLACRVPVPLARVADAEQAAAINRRLGALGLPLAVLSDEEIAARPAEVKRVRRLEMTSAGLRLWCRPQTDAGEEASEIPFSDLVALVRGRLISRARELSAPIKRKSKRESASPGESLSPLADDGANIADEPVLDIYAAAPVCTWRIAANSFDYTCLGARRALLARDNFELLVGALRFAASTARFDDSYTRIRALLDCVWIPGEHTEARGRIRRGLNRFDVLSRIVTINDDQFTRYARTHAHLERERRRHKPERTPASAPPTDIPCT